MKILEDTITKLDYIASLSNNIVLVPGKKQHVYNAGILCYFDIEDNFQEAMGLYDIKKFIKTLDFIPEYDLTIQNNNFVIKNDKQKIKYLIGDLQILKTNYRKDNIDFDKLNKLEEVCISIESDKFKNITKIANQFNCTTFKFITRAQTIVLQLIDDLSNVIYEEEFGDTNVELSSEYLMDDVLKVHPEKNMYNINLLVLERQTILNINTSLMQYYMSEKKGI